MNDDFDRWPAWTYRDRWTIPDDVLASDLDDEFPEPDDDQDDGQQEFEVLDDIDDQADDDIPF